MTDLSSDLASAGRRRGLARAVHRNGALSSAGLSERLFALLFSGLVYPQIWEDPDVDMEAMAARPRPPRGHHRLGRLQRSRLSHPSPAAVDAVDLNRGPHRAQPAEARRRCSHLPAHARSVPLLRRRRQRHNEAAYDRFIAPHLDAATRALLGRADWRGRRRIARVRAATSTAPGCSACSSPRAHRVARLYGVDLGRDHGCRVHSPSSAASSSKSSRRCSTSRLIKLALRRARPRCSASASRRRNMTRWSAPATAAWRPCCRRGWKSSPAISRWHDNYFAWQAFARRYPAPGEAALPAYLEDAQLRDDPRQRRPRAASTTPISPSCSRPRQPAASTASSCSTPRTG